MPAFGSQGPYREFVGYGETLEGAGGLARLSGYEPSAPIRSGIAYPDPLVGHYGALAAALGLMHREETGAGLWLDVSHQECVLHMIGDAVLHYQLTGKLQEPSGNARADLVLNVVLPCRGDDEWVAITVETPGQLRPLAEATGIAALAQVPLAAAALGDLRVWVEARDKRAIMEEFVAHGVAAGAGPQNRRALRRPASRGARFLRGGRSSSCRREASSGGPTSVLPARWSALTPRRRSSTGRRTRFWRPCWARARLKSPGFVLVASLADPRRLDAAAMTAATVMMRTAMRCAALLSGVHCGQTSRR